MIENKLIYKDNKFSIDIDNLEELASHEKARFLLLCNPHNPSGRLWTKEELLKIIAIAKKHNLIVISDEIHCDIRPNGSVFHALTTLDEMPTADDHTRVFIACKVGGVRLIDNILLGE